MTRGIRGGWQSQNPGWRSANNALFDMVARTTVLVLVWGPAESWGKYYEKRIQIIDHLRDSNPNNDVAMSEDLMKQDPRFEEMKLTDAELFHLRSAQIAFLLIVDERRVTGVQAEVLTFERSADFRQKAWLLKPKVSQKQAKRAGYLQQGWVNYDPARCLVYTPEEFEDCTKIRAFCLAKVEAMRHDLAMNGIFQGRAW